MSALTPDCDPDLSNCGSPVDGAAGGSGPGGARVRSTVLLFAVLVASASVASSAGTSGAAAYLAGGVALVSALTLGRRTVALGRRLASSAAARGSVVRSAQPVG